MLRDLNETGLAADATYDACIIGAGAAGIALALKLAKAGQRVALCEGGDLEFTSESQDIYIGETTGDPYPELDACRLRFFGGSTNHWGGKSRPLDAFDFERDDLGPDCVWPIGRADLDPYLAEACEIVEIDEVFHDELLDPANGVKRVEFKYSPPTYFGERFGPEIEAAPNIDLYTNANFVDFEGEDGTVTAAVFANYAGTRHSLPAQRFVLAMGGIENPRYLLWIHEMHGGRFFDPALPLGRYWMDHPHFVLGQALVESPVEPGQIFAITEEVQRRHGILNCGLELDLQGDDQTERLINEVLCIAPALGERLVALAGKNLVCGVRLRAAWEQAPHFDNRVTLSSTDRDLFGIPKPVLHWQKREIDRRTIETSCAVFNDWLLDSDIGRLRLDDWLLDHTAYPENGYNVGPHHMGGTRMGTDRATSVVDADCRVHGSSNIYMAGSSVFPTGGHANPTLTIIQLALRLGDHLRE